GSALDDKWYVLPNWLEHCTVSDDPTLPPNPLGVSGMTTDSGSAWMQSALAYTTSALDPQEDFYVEDSSTSALVSPSAPPQDKNPLETDTTTTPQLLYDTKARGRYMIRAPRGEGKAG